MLSFLGFGRSASEKEESSPVTVPQPAPTSAANSHDKQREMIRLALSGVLRRHGIASHWFGCEVTPLRASRNGVMLVQLVVLKWHDDLVRHAPDLQSQLFKEIHLFDNSVDAEDILFVWKFAPDCGYPNGVLPGAQHWSVAASTPSSEAPKVAAPFELPASHLDEADDDDNDGFAPTQMHSSL
jgi:hypothetical protein